MSLNRRGLLTLLGGAAASPIVGAKAAAHALGVDLAVGSGIIAPIPAAPGDRHHWYGSTAQLAMQAKEAARNYERHRYDHMRSWGPAFRQSVIEREIFVESLFRSECERNEGFMAKVWGVFK